MSGCQTAVEKAAFAKYDMIHRNLFYISDVNEARKCIASWHENSEYLTEFGDTNGPYRHVAGAVVSSNARGFHFIANVDDYVTELFPDPYDTNVELQVYYFVNPKGNCYGIIHKSKEE